MHHSVHRLPLCLVCGRRERTTCIAKYRTPSGIVHFALFTLLARDSSTVSRSYLSTYLPHSKGGTKTNQEGCALLCCVLFALRTLTGGRPRVFLRQEPGTSSSMTPRRPQCWPLLCYRMLQRRQRIQLYMRTHIWRWTAILSGGASCILGSNGVPG